MATRKVAWDNIPAETGYRIKWGTTQGGPYTLNADVAADILTYTITGLVDGTRYYSVVYALDAFGTEGEVSNELTWIAGTVAADVNLPVAAFTLVSTLTTSGVLADLSQTLATFTLSAEGAVFG